MGHPLRGSIPDCYGGFLDTGTGLGVLFLEDIAPAVQGDVLIDPGDEVADATIQVIASVHASSWRARAADYPAALPRWQAEVWDADRWCERLAGARARFPELLTDQLDRRLERLPGELGDAIAGLRAGPASWIHTDAHLDNILWRPDGSVVLLDWASAVIGPPAVDAARFLIEGPPGLAADERRSLALVETYQRELVARGVPRSVAGSMSIAVGQAMLPLAQSIIGWGGRPDSEPSAPRTVALRENAVRNVASWLSR
jgi:aminoglycoside/choline kinase family phosphotransferase